MDIRAPNTTRVVRALFKVQDEDRPVEFFSPLSRPPTFFFSGKTRCTLRILCSVSFVPASSIACSSDHGTLQTIFPDFSYVPSPPPPSFFVPFVRLPDSPSPSLPSFRVFVRANLEERRKIPDEN